MPTTKNILIFGATGLIGTPITEQILLAKENNLPGVEFERIVIFTSAGTVEKKSDVIEKLKKRGVEVVVGDLGSEEDVRRGYDGIDTVVSAVGRPIITQQIQLLQWASTTPSIKKFFPSEYGTDIAYSPASAHEKPHQQKLKVRAFIDENLTAPHKDAGLEITYLVTGPYSDLFLRPAFPGSSQAGSFDISSSKAIVLGDGAGKVSLTSMRDVGVLLVAALTHPLPSPGVRALKVNSFTTTPLEIVGEFERQTESKWEVEYVPLEEVRRVEKERWEANDPVATAFTLRRIWAEGGTLYEERDNGAIGEPRVQGLAETVGEAVGRGK